VDTLTYPLQLKLSRWDRPDRKVCGNWRRWIQGIHGAFIAL